ncbi:preprotein translocase subunit SecY [candidate division LCP-89 bacterium B3_LCP]|uniref:Protein translocase subunit SecY n=1 Tax=candidate division LCP-89 bacterium B3_LCP TaxID=2012998 RepID=A0A532UZU8_UNCL8|nr:MAG: preprotein translocase subunit SecY [candidate division LCP-89 bacterium B3_LCP]
MMKSFQSVFRIPELRKRILFTLGIFIVYRIGSHVPSPGVNAEALGEFFKMQQNTLFGLYDMFSGGAFGKATVFALGIMPYISASIIIQLMGTVVPYFQKLQKMGEEGRKKITQLTRYGTVGISVLQSLGVSVFLESIVTPSGILAVPHPGMGFRLLIMLTLTTGVVFIMWLGEQISERGIGNGISLLIFIGIIDRLPFALMDEIRQFISGNRALLMELFMIALFVAVTASVVLLTQGTRKIAVQYAKKVVGRKVYGGQRTHIPLRVNTAGVMPIIFAQSIMFVPSTVATFLPESGFKDWLNMSFNIESYFYMLFYGTLIVFFTYFYTAVAFNPVDVADNMKKYGGFIPGIRPGKATSDYMDNILTRITLPGSIYLGFIAILPSIITRYSNVNYNYASFFGGTSLLIVVGVALDTLQQIESHLLTRHYDGFMKSGKFRGRRRM